MANSLKAKPEAAEAQLDQGNPISAVNQLTAVISELEGFVRAGQLTLGDGQGLTEYIQRIIWQIEP